MDNSNNSNNSNNPLPNTQPSTTPNNNPYPTSPVSTPPPASPWDATPPSNPFLNPNASQPFTTAPATTGSNTSAFPPQNPWQAPSPTPTVPESFFNTPPQQPASNPWDNSNPFPAPTPTFPPTPNTNQPDTQPWSPPDSSTSLYSATGQTTPDLSNSMFTPPQPQPTVDIPTIPTIDTPPSIPQAQPLSPEPTPVENTSTFSPLDNPWNAPSQTPIVSGDTTPAPVEMNYSVENPSTNIPSPQQTPGYSDPKIETNPIPQPSTNFPPVNNSETAAPTDLSHLITGNNHNEESTKTEPAETLVVPSTFTPDIPTVTEEKKGIPKWLIGVGIGLLILVSGASAYFILGIGKAPQTPTSAPAQVTEAPQVRPPAPIPTPASEANPATGSANFGELEGSGTQQATSAADLIRQRQQQGR